MTTDNSAPDAGTLDMIHKHNYWIADAERVGDEDGLIRIVNNMERLLAPFKDPEYMGAIEQINEQRPKKANTSAERAFNNMAFAIKAARLKHEELCKLIARSGFYPVRSIKQTTKIASVSKTYDYTQGLSAEEVENSLDN